jgi:uncharacterized protein DUF998
MIAPGAARPLLWAGVVGPPLFVAVFMVDGLIHPAYNPVTDFVSELSRGELGWLQIINFLFLAAALLTFAVGIYWGARRGPGSVAGAALFAIMGASLVVAGLAVTDAHTSTVQTPAGTLHNISALPAFASLIAACFVFSRRFGGGMRAYSIASGVFVLVFLFATFLVGLPFGIVGIVQRILIIGGWTWITILAVALRSETVPSSLSGGRPLPSEP